MSERKIIALVGAALVVPLLLLAGPVSAADEAGPCTVTGPTQSPSDVVTGGTKIVFSVACEGEPRTHSIGTTVSQTLDGEPQIVLDVQDTVSLGGGSGAMEKALHVPTPPTPGIDVCIQIDGQKVPPGCTPPAS